MNLTAFSHGTALLCLACCLTWGAPSALAQSNDASSLPSGAQMMEDLVRLTMVPLAEAPLTFEGNLVYELTSPRGSTMGELRWGNEGDCIMWTDALDKQGLYTIQLDASQPLATLRLMNEEGHFMTPQMMTLAKYWTAEGTPHPATRPLKLDRKAAPDTILGRACYKHDVKVGKERAILWVAQAEDTAGADANASLRTAWGHWIRSRVPSDALRGLILPEGIPMKVEWGVPNQEGELPHAMTVATLNPAASFTLNAPEIFMHVPGRDINEVARELREKEEADSEKD